MLMFVISSWPIFASEKPTDLLALSVSKLKLAESEVVLNKAAFVVDERPNENAPATGLFTWLVFSFLQLSAKKMIKISGAIIFIVLKI